MHVDTAVLCDGATIREGLLHILGAGITRLWRPELPAGLGVSIAMLVDMERELEDTPHEVRIVIDGPAGERVAEAVAGIQYQGGVRFEVGEHHLIPLVMPLHDVGLASYGRYTMTATVDGIGSKENVFWVLHPDEQTLPSIVD